MIVFSIHPPQCTDPFASDHIRAYFSGTSSNTYISHLIVKIRDRFRPERATVTLERWRTSPGP